MFVNTDRVIESRADNSRLLSSNQFWGQLAALRGITPTPNRTISGRSTGTRNTATALKLIFALGDLFPLPSHSDGLGACCQTIKRSLLWLSGQEPDADSVSSHFRHLDRLP